MATEIQLCDCFLSVLDTDTVSCLVYVVVVGKST